MKRRDALKRLLLTLALLLMACGGSPTEPEDRGFYWSCRIYQGELECHKVSK